MVAEKKDVVRGPHRPATTVQGREDQLVAMAYDLVEKQIREGTASSQSLSYFLKAGAAKTQLEIEKLQNENALAIARIKAIEQGDVIEKLYGEAIKAMRKYQGADDEDVYDE